MGTPPLCAVCCEAWTSAENPVGHLARWEGGSLQASTLPAGPGTLKQLSDWLHEYPLSRVMVDLRDLPMWAYTTVGNTLLCPTHAQAREWATFRDHAAAARLAGEAS
jgi:hypothetical protein